MNEQRRYSTNEIQQRVLAMSEACRANGMKVTQQRVEILSALLHSGEHMSAEAVYDRVKSDFPAISLSTVYSTLETLSGLGVIGTVDGLDGPRLFDPESAPHHHLVDRETGRVIDLDDSDHCLVDREALRQRGIEVDDVRLIVYGRLAGGSMSPST
jgi:Fur family peroxide stress response transcriptional regulator